MFFYRSSGLYWYLLRLLYWRNFTSQSVQTPISVSRLSNPIKNKIKTFSPRPLPLRQLLFRLRSGTWQKYSWDKTKSQIPKLQRRACETTRLSFRFPKNDKVLLSYCLGSLRTTILKKIFVGGRSSWWQRCVSVGGTYPSTEWRRRCEYGIKFQSGMTDSRILPPGISEIYYILFVDYFVDLSSNDTFLRDAYVILEDCWFLSRSIALTPISHHHYRTIPHAH